MVVMTTPSPTHSPEDDEAIYAAVESARREDGVIAFTADAI